jgi:hypothetical protein
MTADEAIAPSAAPGSQHASFASTFIGILTAPVETLKELNENFSSLDSYTLTNHVFNAVFLALALDGMARINVTTGWFSIMNIIVVIANGMITWLMLAVAMVVLASLSKDHEIPWKKALTLTGWPFLPLIFCAPLAAYKQMFGPFIFVFGFAPLIWTTILQLHAFKIALNLSNGRLMALCLILPPVIASAYLFWMLFAGSLLVGEIISYIR